jgi:hypothetical protein
VFVRRVQVDFSWLAPIWDRFAEIVLGRQRHEPAPETMARLRSRKAEVDRSLESRRAAARFEPDAALPVDSNPLTAAQSSSGDAKAVKPQPPVPSSQSPVPDEDTYTSRLLKAKKQVWQDRAQDRGLDPDAKDDKP